MPTALWCGTLEDLQKSAALVPDQMLAKSQKLFLKTSELEYRSWKSTVKILTEHLKSAENANAEIFSKLVIMLEVFMPSGKERADCVILGGKNTKTKPIVGLILELKEWSHCIVNNDSEFVDIGHKNKVLRRHPLIQAWNYKGKLANFSSISLKIEWWHLALVPNLPDIDLEKLRRHPKIPPEQAFKILGKSSFSECCKLLVEKGFLGRKLDTSRLHNFLESSFSYPQGLFTYARNNIGKFREQALFMDGGFGLTDEQQQLCEEILNTLESGKSAHFVIEGSPGSGKTMVAMMLLAQTLAKNKKAAMALLGKQLSHIMKTILRSLYRDGGGELIYSIHGGKYKDSTDIITLAGGGLKGQFDLMIVDEAQRMRKEDIPTILETAKVTVMLLDEKQRLAAEEEGTVKNFHTAIGDTYFFHRQLPSAMRCRGGQEYLDWIEGILQTTEKATPLSQQSWTRKYLFKVFDDLEDMRTALRKRRESGNTVALLASFTESSGKKTSGKIDGNIRIGPKLESGAELYASKQSVVRWVMHNEPYERFWLEGECNNLTSAAAVYGAQGFEREYIGLIWGRDFVYDNSFKIGTPECCYDPKLVYIKGIGHSWRTRQSAILHELFYNRYWILLTRGIMGTYIYCEDPNTAAFLKGLQ